MRSSCQHCTMHIPPYIVGYAGMNISFLVRIIICWHFIMLMFCVDVGCRCSTEGRLRWSGAGEIPFKIYFISDSDLLTKNYYSVLTKTTRSELSVCLTSSWSLDRWNCASFCHKMKFSNPPSLCFMIRNRVIRFSARITLKSLMNCSIHLPENVHVLNLNILVAHFTWTLLSSSRKYEQHS